MCIEQYKTFRMICANLKKIWTNAFTHLFKFFSTFLYPTPKCKYDFFYRYIKTEIQFVHP